MKTYIINASLIIILICSCATAPDSNKGMSMEEGIESLTQQIVQSFESEEKQKIAILGFTDLYGDETELGEYIAEELTTQLFLSKKFDVIERRLVDKIFKEHEFQLSDSIDENTAKTIGKLIGASAICTGTISKLDKTIKINARIISTGTGLLFAAAAVNINSNEAISKEEDFTLDDDLSMEERSRQMLTEIFDICKEGNLKKADKYILSGKFEAGKITAFQADYDNPDDQKQIDALCGVISSHLFQADKYEFINFFVDTEPEGLFYIYEVEFYQGDEPDTVQFVFFKQNEYYGLVQIN